MKWGDTQNLLSVIIGLNIAYYAFKEMRTPHLSNLNERVRELNSDVGTKISEISSAIIPNSNEFLKAVVDLHLRTMDLQGKTTGLVVGTSSRRFENKLGLPAMIVATLGTVLLVVSTVLYNDDLPAWLFWLVVVVGFTPVVLMILLNYLILWHAETTIGKEYHELWNTLHLDIGKQLAPHHRALSWGRYAKEHGLSRQEQEELMKFEEESKRSEA